ncbi:MAG TPA: hypothetical protein VGM90_39465 [Kofleriaceae bacterium]|jgi:hypothetical protein
MRILAKPLGWVVAATLLVGTVQPGWADDDDDKVHASLVDGRAIQEAKGIEIGAIMMGGHSELASNQVGLSPNAQGLFIRDRNGVTSRMVIGLLVAIGGALAQSGPKSVESKSYTSGDYIVTETTTTYYSEAEKAEMAKATNDTIDSLFNARYSDFELDVYSRDKFERGDTSGYKINMLVGDGSGKWSYETGLGFGKVDSIVDRMGAPVRVDWSYLGMPFRVAYAAGPLRFALTYEWNWLKYGVDKKDRLLHLDAAGDPEVRATSHPWHFDVSTLLMKRIAISGGVTTQVASEHQLGYFAQAGVFF